MAYGDRGLNAALSGVTLEGTHLALHTADPTTTGAGEDVAVVRIAAAWLTPAGGEVTSTEGGFAIPAEADGALARDYTHFSVRAGATVTAGDFVCGGALDEPERFSANGGTYNFTATLTAASAPAV